MNSDTGIIAFTGLPDIVVEGLINVLHEHLPQYRTYKFESLAECKTSASLHNVHLIITDGTTLDLNHKIYTSIRKDYPEIAWLLFQYQYLNSSLTAKFEEIITIDMDLATIINLIHKSLHKDDFNIEDNRTEALSDREKEVLKLFIEGLSGKEVAEKLSISVNTVMSHRKNISQKTGIKSLAGLTIYAVTNKIISMNRL